MRCVRGHAWIQKKFEISPLRQRLRPRPAATLSLYANPKSAIRSIRPSGRGSSRFATNSEGLQPLLYARPELLDVRFQTMAEINMRSSLERHRPRTAHDLPQIFD